MSTAATPRNWKRWLIGAGAALVAAVVGGPFVYIHFIEGKAPAPLGLTTQTTTALAVGASSPTTTGATSATPAAVDGTWKIAAGSVAGYRIKETLFGQSNTAVGRTGGITGSITIAGTTVRTAEFSVDVTTMTSDQHQRDGQFQGRIMNTAAFPTASFALTQPIQLASIPAEGTTVTESATGKLTLHGTSKTVTFTVEARRTAATISVSGSIPIVFSDYSINNPSGGPATTASSGLLEFLLNFTHA